MNYYVIVFVGKNWSVTLGQFREREKYNMSEIAETIVVFCFFFMDYCRETAWVT